MTHVWWILWWFLSSSHLNRVHSGPYDLYWTVKDDWAFEMGSGASVVASIDDENDNRRLITWGGSHCQGVNYDDCLNEDDTWSSELYSLDPKSSNPEWTLLNDGSSISNFTVSSNAHVIIDNVIFVLNSKQSPGGVFTYHGSSNTMTEYNYSEVESPLPRTAYSCNVYNGTYIFVIGGYDQLGGILYDTVQIFNPNTLKYLGGGPAGFADNMTGPFIDPLPIPTCLSACNFYEPTQLIYFYGGVTQEGITDAIYRYSQSENQWTTLPVVLPHPRRNFRSVLLRSHYVYMIGYRVDVEIFDITSETIQTAKWNVSSIPLRNPGLGLWVPNPKNPPSSPSGGQMVIVGGIANDRLQKFVWKGEFDEGNGSFFNQTTLILGGLILFIVVMFIGIMVFCLIEMRAKKREKLSKPVELQLGEVKSISTRAKSDTPMGLNEGGRSVESDAAEIDLDAASGATTPPPAVMSQANAGHTNNDESEADDAGDDESNS